MHLSLQCFDAVGWVAWRASSLQKLSGAVLAWLSVRREVQMICIWSSWCHCHLIISCSSKIQNGLPFWCQFTQIVLEKRPLNDVVAVEAMHLPPYWISNKYTKRNPTVFHTRQFAIWQFSKSNRDKFQVKSQSNCINANQISRSEIDLDLVKS